MRSTFVYLYDRVWTIPTFWDEAVWCYDDLLVPIPIHVIEIGWRDSDSLITHSEGDDNTPKYPSGKYKSSCSSTQYDRTSEWIFEERHGYLADIRSHPGNIYFWRSRYTLSSVRCSRTMDRVAFAPVHYFVNMQRRCAMIWASQPEKCKIRSHHNWPGCLLFVPHLYFSHYALSFALHNTVRAVGQQKIMQCGIKHTQREE